MGIGEERAEPIGSRAGPLLTDDPEGERRGRAEPDISRPRRGDDSFGHIGAGGVGTGGGKVRREHGDRLDGRTGHFGLGRVLGPLEERREGLGNRELTQGAAEIDAKHLRLLAGPPALGLIREDPAELHGKGGIGLQGPAPRAAEVVGEVEGRLPASFVVAAERADVGLRVLAEVSEPVEGEPDADNDRDDQPRHEEKLDEKPRARWFDRREELIRRHRPAGMRVVGGGCHGADRRGERGEERTLYSIPAAAPRPDGGVFPAARF